MSTKNRVQHQMSTPHAGVEVQVVRFTTNLTSAPTGIVSAGVVESVVWTANGQFRVTFNRKVRALLHCSADLSKSGAHDLYVINQGYDQANKTLDVTLKQHSNDNASNSTGYEVSLLCFFKTSSGVDGSGL